MNEKVYTRNIDNKKIKFKCSNEKELIRIKTFIYEEGILRDVLRTIQPGMVFYDIGANIGIYSLFIAKWIKDTKVYAFEPEGKNYYRIRDNMVINKINNIEILPIALGEKRKQGELYLYSDKISEGGHSLLPLKEKEAILVEVWDLDSYLLKYQLYQPDFIKIDVEGYEIQVLEGMKETIKRNTPLFLIELHPGLIDSCQYIYDLLYHNNYYLEEIETPRNNQIFILARPDRNARND